MKHQTTTTPVLKRFVTSSSIVALAVMMTFSSVLPAFADQFDDQIKVIEGRISGYQQQAVELGRQASDLQATISKLQAEQNALQAQIDLSQAKYDQLTAQIKETEEKIEKNKQALGDTITSIYVSNNVSPVEMLASSSTIGDYLDQQEYRSSIREGVESAIKEIKALKKSLETKKAEVEAVINDQKNQNTALAAKQDEQTKLLTDTQGNQAAYNGLIGQQNQQISSLRAQQAAAISAAGGNEGIVFGSSAYLWPNESMNYNDNCIYPNGSSGSDPWGYCYRQCVSYVAWKLNSDGKGNRGYSGLGNANNWGIGGSAISWDNLQEGDVIIWYVGGYGHVMYVDNVAGDTVNISQMNVPYDSGRYSTKTYSLSTLSSGAYEARRFH